MTVPTSQQALRSRTADGAEVSILSERSAAKAGSGSAAGLSALIFCPDTADAASVFPAASIASIMVGVRADRPVDTSVIASVRTSMIPIRTKRADNHSEEGIARWFMPAISGAAAATARAAQRKICSGRPACRYPSKFPSEFGQRPVLPRPSAQGAPAISGSCRQCRTCRSLRPLSTRGRWSGSCSSRSMMPDCPVHPARR